MTQIYEIEDEFSICDESCQKLEKLLCMLSDNCMYHNPYDNYITLGKYSQPEIYEIPDYGAFFDDNIDHVDDVFTEMILKPPLYRKKQVAFNNNNQIIGDDNVGDGNVGDSNVGDVVGDVVQGNTQNNMQTNIQGDTISNVGDVVQGNTQMNNQTNTQMDTQIDTQSTTNNTNFIENDQSRTNTNVSNIESRPTSIDARTTNITNIENRTEPPVQELQQESELNKASDDFSTTLEDSKMKPSEKENEKEKDQENDTGASEDLKTGSQESEIKQESELNKSSDEFSTTLEEEKTEPIDPSISMKIKEKQIPKSNLESIQESQESIKNKSQELGDSLIKSDSVEPKSEPSRDIPKTLESSQKEKQPVQQMEKQPFKSPELNEIKTIEKERPSQPTSQPRSQPETSPVERETPTESRQASPQKEQQGIKPPPVIPSKESLDKLKTEVPGDVTIEKTETTTPGYNPMYGNPMYGNPMMSQDTSSKDKEIKDLREQLDKSKNEKTFDPALERENEKLKEEINEYKEQIKYLEKVKQHLDTIKKDLEGVSLDELIKQQGEVDEKIRVLTKKINRA